MRATVVLLVTEVLYATLNPACSLETQVSDDSNDYFGRHIVYEDDISRGLIIPRTNTCGEKCNVSYYINDTWTDSVITWSSHNWRVSNYVEDCTCKLSLKIKANVTISIEFDDQSSIYGDKDCSFDKILFDGIFNSESMCNTTMINLSPRATIQDSQLEEFNVTFVTSSNDGGNTDVGFSLTIKLDVDESRTSSIRKTQELMRLKSDKTCSYNGVEYSQESAIFINCRLYICWCDGYFILIIPIVYHPGCVQTGNPVTAKPPARCGEECNKHIVLTSTTPSGVFNWDSHNWGVGDYPDDCTCTLNVQVEADASVATLFNPLSVIAGSDNCIYDNIQFTGDIDIGPLCGTDVGSSPPNFQVTSEDNPYEFTVTFTSTSEDGDTTDDGYSLSIIYTNHNAPVGTHPSIKTTTTKYPPLHCGIDCNKIITITSSMASDVFNWESNNFGEENYPEDCVCVLTVQVDASASITTYLNPLSAISESEDCMYDSLQFSGDINSDLLCGTSVSSFIPVSAITEDGSPYEFTVTFTSSSEDGGTTDTGYSLSVVYHNLDESKLTTIPNIKTTTTNYPPLHCGVDCDKTITITSSMASNVFNWESNDFGNGHYPEDCVCVLTVQVDADATITTLLNPSSAISGSEDCMHDSLQFSGDINSGLLCGDGLSSFAPVIYNTEEGDVYQYTVTFTSTSEDGDTPEDGYSLSIIYVNKNDVFTTPSSTPCGIDCNKTITITEDSGNGIYNWNSKDWDIGDYPEDCVCVLNVKVDADACITTFFNPSSALADSDDCVYDNIKFTGDVNLGPICGTNIGSITPIVQNTEEGNVYEFQVTFTSTSDDGDMTDDGYSLSIVYGNSGNPQATTLPPSQCGHECDKNVFITPSTDSGIYTWKSKDWGISHYPEDCTCTLNVQINADAGITAYFDPASIIAESEDCLKDNIKFIGDVTSGLLCGDISNQMLPIFENTNEGIPYEFTVTFTSTSEDGDLTDDGYLFSIIYNNLGNTNHETTANSGGPGTAAPSHCGPDCDKTIVITSSTDNGIYTWSSEGWGTNEYPEDCTCTLNVQVDADASLTGFFDSASAIAGDGNCMYDNIQISGDISLGPLCGSITDSMQPIFVNTDEGTPYEFSVTFTSTSDDGDETDNGYSFSLIYHNNGDSGSGNEVSSSTMNPYDHCGPQCHTTLILNSSTPSAMYSWKSDNFGIGDYPEDCVCVLNVQINAESSITTFFNPSSMLADSEGCIYDNIQASGGISFGPLCGSDLATLPPTFLNTEDGEYVEFTVTFNTDSDDGGITDDGYEFTIVYNNNGPSMETSPAPIPYCGIHCNKTIVITPLTLSNVYHWNSKDWGIANYPDDCICQLNFRIDSDSCFTAFFNPASIIADSDACMHDNIQFTGDITFGPLCGSDLSEFTPIFENTNEGSPYEFTVTFTSTSNDGSSTDIGFSFSIIYNAE